MSRPRSRSPRYRRFPWDEPQFKSHRGGSEQDGDRLDGSEPERFREYFGEEAHSGGPRRAPPRHEERRHPVGQKEFPPRRPSPRRQDVRYAQQRFSPPRGAWRGADRRGGGFGPRPRDFQDGGPSSPSPGGPRPDHQQREPEGWRREERGRSRSRGRFREFSPGGGSDQERGRRSSQAPPPQDRNLPPVNWQKGALDGEQQAGFRDEEDFGGQGYSVDSPRGGFGGRRWGRARPSGTGRGGVHGRWERFEGDGGLEPDCPGFRDEPRERRFHQTRRSPPPPQDRAVPGRFGNRGGPGNYRGRGSFRPMRHRYNHHRGARTGPTGQQREYRDLPEEEQRGYRPLLKDPEDPAEEEEEEEEEDRDLDPKMPRQRQRALKRTENGGVAAETEETLTIKVDMSRPAQHNSLLCYSSDRQLSLDLVNVGRQRLDFLPMLEHSGSYRETAVHTGTFAQEIITLVHQVKDQYFRGEHLTMNQRFSAAQKSSYSQEVEELTLDQRFSSSRGFTLNMGVLLDEDETPRSSLGHLQSPSQPPVRGPGDLRHDLERRRQEKLEGVKVTIPGQSAPQRPLVAGRELQEEEEEEEQEYSCRMKEDFEGVSDWMEEQSMKREGRMGLRRGGAPSRPAPFFHRRNQHFANRRTNFQSGSTGPDW